MEISDRITMTIPQFLTASGLGRSKTYDLIEAREIESALVDRRRVIIVQSYLDYLDRQKRAEANGVGRIASPNPRAAANRKGSGPSPADVGQKSWIASPVANDPAPPRRPGDRPPKHGGRSPAARS